MMIKCMVDDFDINNAPNVVFIFDKERCMFWKQSRYGYADSVYDAGLFELDEAKKIVKNNLNKNTKIVWL